jgi:undecaprenyl-diphosphatase
MSIEVLKAVSSSGHLVLAKSFLGLQETGITMEVMTHLATALAVIVFLRKRIVEILAAVGARVTPGKEVTESVSRDFRLFLFVILGSVPAAIVGLLMQDRIESLFESVTSTAVMFIITGVFIFVTGKFGKVSGPLGAARAVLVGVAQAFAIIPGISRSGLTVGTGLAVGLERKAAFEFSLLLSLPAILGASLLELVGGKLGGNPVVIMAGALPAFVGGYFAINLLFRIVMHRRFHAFAYYLIPLGLLILFL